MYAIVDVDTENRKLNGVPQSWHALLADELVDRVRRTEARMARVQGTDEDKELRQLLSDGKLADVGADWQTAWISAQLSDRDLLVAPEEHRDSLQPSASVRRFLGAALRIRERTGRQRRPEVTS